MGDAWTILASVLLVGVLAALGNLYAHRTASRPAGTQPQPVRWGKSVIPFVTLKMLLDGLLYSLWIRGLDEWGFSPWAKVAITSGLYTPVYYLLFFYGMEFLTLGPRAALSPAHLAGFGTRVWAQLKPVWRVDFWYFLVADSVSFYGGPWMVAQTGFAPKWNNEVVFAIFCAFDFAWDVVLARALHGGGVVNEKQVYLEARRAAAQLLGAIQRRRRRKSQP